MNKIVGQPQFWDKLTPKIVTIVLMRIFLLFIGIGLSSLYANPSYAQTKISVDVNEVSYEELFAHIQEKSEFIFFYNDNVLNTQKKVSLHLIDQKLSTILDQAFKNTDLDYLIIDRQVVIKKKELPIKADIPVIIKPQGYRVSGTVTDTNGIPLPGASVVEKGTTNGTQTDFDGNYTLDLNSQNAVLIFSYIGYTSQEISYTGQTSIPVSLIEDVSNLDEVVVTALGIERSKRSLAYSVSKVDGDEFTEARETNIANGLAGKVAGVNVTNAATGPAGTTRVIIRGNSSLTGNNQPLYVVDGIPIDNQNRGAAGEWGGSDAGDGIGNINPDDIASMSVLKGNTAAALYGSLASNGVIIITTKKGQLDKGIQVELNSNFVIEDAINHLDPQKEYGHGLNGEKPTTQAIAWDAGEYSWGAPLDGSGVIQFDGVVRPYAVSGDNFKKFYRMGTTFTNTVAISGGSPNLGYRFSASNMDNESVMPNSGMKRQNFSMNMHGKGMDDRLTFQASASYILVDVRNQPSLADSPGNANYSVWQLPVTTNVYDLKGDPDRLGALTAEQAAIFNSQEGYELLPSSSIWFQNPYWTAYQQTKGYSKNRLLGSTSLQYELHDLLYIKGRGGIDQFNRTSQYINPTGTGHNVNGGMHQGELNYKQTNFDVMLGSHHEFDNGIRYDILLGANKMRLEENTTNANSNNFALPFFYSLANGISNTGTTDYSKLGTHSVYGQLEISYNNWLFLTGSARNDWFSVLDGRDVFYPSVGVSAVLSDALNLPEIFDFAKVRASWAQVGGVGDIGAYSLNQNYSLGNAHLGVPNGGISGSTVRNSNLNPLIVTELELGFNIQLLNNRLGLDFSYYDKITEDDILNVGISHTSAYTSATVNVGELYNKGVEVLLTGTPVRTNNFNWDVSFNMGYNKSEVVSLIDPENDEEAFNIGTSRSRNVWVTQIEGKPFGQITGTTYLRDANGNIELDANGYPQVDVDAGAVAFGTGVHPFSAGLQNKFRYKDWNLGFLIDMRDGAVGHSGTNQQLYRRGVHKNTLTGRENGIGIVPANEIRNYYDVIYNDIAEEFIYDAGFVKLREVTLGYTFPSRFLGDSFIRKASISLVGRNLWLIHSNVDNIDPESGYNSGNAQGLEFFALPQTRSFGFNVNLTF